MARVSIEPDEWWPFPILNRIEGEHAKTGDLTTYEVEAGTLKRWENAIADCEAVIAEIWQFVDARDKDARKRR